MMLSGGGIAALRVAQEAPIQMIESGPAAGAISGAYYGRADQYRITHCF